MSRFVAPPASDGPYKLADWIEIEALRDDDRRCSFEDLVSALRTSGSVDGVDDTDPEDDSGSQKVHELAESAFNIIEFRHGVSSQKPGSYPYLIKGTSLQFDGEEGSPYTFLLLSSYFGGSIGSVNDSYTQLFEDLCAVAIQDHLGGSATGAMTYQMGHPRRAGQPANFAAAVTAMCAELHDGGSVRIRPRMNAVRDGKLDVVAWIPMLDRRQGKFIGFGQCATGSNWKDKLAELQAEAWCNTWLAERPVQLPARMFFVPHAIPDDEWLTTSFQSGIIFDRLRIAHHSTKIAGTVASRVSDWNRAALSWLRG